MSALFRVDGMTCGACTASITEALEALPGVQQASVSLVTEQAKVVFDEQLISVGAISEAIEGCGFEAEVLSTKETTNTLETTISIRGMTCGACSASITEALEALEGVVSASISLLTESGQVTHTSGVSSNRIVEVVEDCGFECWVSSSSGGMGRTTVSVGGMTCSACTGAISDALKSIEGVEKVSVSLVTEQAVVEHTQEVDAETIVNAIQDCGFDAQLVKDTDEEEEEVSFEISGINEHTDIPSFQYNLEALLSSMGGVVDFQIALKDHASDLSEPIVTSSNSWGIRAIRGQQDIDEDENLIDELVVRFSPSTLGIRDLVDSLNGLDEGLSFQIINSLDQASSAQLKMLSRAKDVEYWRRNFFKSVLFGLPVVLMSYTQNTSFWVHRQIIDGLFWVTVLELLPTLYIYLKLGSPFLKKFGSFARNKGRNATMDVLVCISTSVSFGFSVVAVFRSVWYGSEKPPKVLFETVAMLISFVSFGKWLENKAKGAMSTALSKLLSLTPSSCTVISDPKAYMEYLKSNSEMVDFATRTISIDLIQADDVAIVFPGAKVPADGVVVHGSSEVDESLITGEHLPVFKQVGDNVIGGSVNGPDLIHIQIVRSAQKSQLQQIINLVKDSQMNKAPVQRFADYVAARFVPAVVFLSVATFIVWTALCLFLHPSELPIIFQKEENGMFFVCLKIAISVVVVACPCALGLAAPTAVMVGTGVGAHHGVLIKGGDILEEADSVGIILFDKTGTLTTGQMSMVNYKNLSKFDDASFWQLIGSVELNSEHPIGKSITRGARDRLNLADNHTFDGQISEFKVLTGLGVRASVCLNGSSSEIIVCNERMIRQECPGLIEDPNLKDIMETSTNTVAHVIIDGQYSGYMELTDGLKDEAKEVLDYIRHVEGFQVGIITGDTRRAALKIGKQLNIPPCNIFSEVSPVNKDKIVSELKQRLAGAKNAGVAFVGDGINDAPALAKANIGMAISCGTDIAIESADIVLLGNGKSDCRDLVGVVHALKISNATFNRIKMNFIWAAVYNVIMLPFAMGCFLPFNLMLPPVAAAGAMALSSVSVVLSSLMLKRWTPPPILTPRVFDHERDAGVFFDLKRGTVEDYMMVRQSRTRFHGISRFLRQLRDKRPRDSLYEMLPMAS